MNRTPRKGALGALLDEYERVATELRRVIAALTEEEFVRLVDPNTKDENCRSAQTIMAHVVSAGYGYAAYIRAVFGMSTERPPKRLLAFNEVLQEFELMLAFTVATLEGRGKMTAAEIRSTSMHTNWGVTYDLEQMLEHAIVHVMRHRRQIENFFKTESTHA